MAVGKSSATGTVMIGGRGINEGRPGRIKETRVVKAVRVLVKKHPGLCSARVEERRSIGIMLVCRIPRATLSVTQADANIAGKTAGPLCPTPGSLVSRGELVRGAFKHAGIFQVL